MSVEEKIGQLSMLSAGRDVTGPILSADAEEKIRKGLAGSLLNSYGSAENKKFQLIALEQSPHKIPLLFAFDVIHGHRTIFPTNLGLACSWDLDLIQRTAHRAAIEAREDGLHWTFAPMVDICRDPRWGRVAESAGEDTFLGACVAEASVCGFQGSAGTDGLRQPGRLLATAKHFALYGAPDGGRDYNSVEISRHRMFNEYLEPYRACVNAGVGAVMTSFNEIEGIPATGNRWLLRDLLRNQWGFRGLVVSDYTAIAELVTHGITDSAGAARMAIEAGVDVEMVSETYVNHLPALAKQDKQIGRSIEEACRRILFVKEQLGLFDNPIGTISKTSGLDRSLALEAARKAIVLLKNDHAVLPLSPNERILFVGPFLYDRFHQLGPWRAAGDPNLTVSVADALSSRSSNSLLSSGAYLVGESGQQDNTHLPDADAMIKEAVTHSVDCDKIVLLLGESSHESGEGASKTDIRLPAPQRRLLCALSATGKPLILVLISGRPFALSEEEPLASAIIAAWFGGHLAGQAIVDILFGDAEPQGRLAISFPRSVGQIPVFYNHKPTGRPPSSDNRYTSRYIDSPNDPLYPFGFGLSYSQVVYSPTTADSSGFTAEGSLRVAATLSNIGKRPVVETAQLYIRDVVASVTRPVKELKGWRQIPLQPGETKRIEFEITEPMLRFYDAELKFRSEPGLFRAWISPNSCIDTGAAEFSLH